MSELSFSNGIPQRGLLELHTGPLDPKAMSLNEQSDSAGREEIAGSEDPLASCLNYNVLIFTGKKYTCAT